VKTNTSARPSVRVDLPHLRRALDLIDRNYAEPLDLELAAAAAGVSKYHFLRSFAATYGQTPALYLCHRRIERAQDLLRATETSP
jgi:transcriptional regulator GlxA family with amidase domain